MTYSQWMTCFSVLLVVVGLFVMRAQTGQFGRAWSVLRVRATWEARRFWRRVLGKPVQVLPKHVVVRNGRPVTIKDRYYV